MKEKLRDKEYWLSLFSAIAFYCMGISNTLKDNNTTYVIEQINQYDHNIFANNFAVYNTDDGAFIYGRMQVALYNNEYDEGCI